MRGWSRLWFRLDDRVPRGTYLRHGAGLMALKYAVDVSLFYAATGRFWSPLDYLKSVSFLLSVKFNGAPAWLVPALAAWALPFMWIGATMTLRRLLDAGRSPWWSLTFFVPYFNYGMMLILAVVPSAEPAAPHRSVPEPGDRPVPSALLQALAVSAGTGLLMLGFSVLVLEVYGPSLFLGTPFLMGVLAAYLLNRRVHATVRDSIQVTLLALGLVAGATVLLGQEGGVCIAMSIPIALIPATLGALIGRQIARSSRGGYAPMTLSALTLPLGAAALPQRSPPVLREVKTSVIVAAPPRVVWEHVIAFSPIPAPEDLLSRSGIAYPLRARIAGSGVGAVRYCEFSTGAFVEPITAWEPGRRLAFDVVQSPPPMRELSLFSRVNPPHLDGYLVARRGEFRLVALPDGATRLEGSTWYTLAIEPQGYWVLLTDFLIHRIHRRVLAHVAGLSEAGTGGRAQR